VSADQTPRGVDFVALIAGAVFVLFSIISLTVGTLDLPEFGAAPLWVLLIVAGVVLLVSELRGRTDTPSDANEASGSPEFGAWDQDPYR